MTNDHQGYQLGGVLALLLGGSVALGVLFGAMRYARAQTIPQVTTTCAPGPSKDDCPTGHITFCTAVVIADREYRRMWSPRPAACSTLKLGDDTWSKLGCSCHIEDLPADRRKGRVEYR